MELACAIGSSKLDGGVALELDSDVVLALVMVIVVKVMKEPVEIAELEDKIDEVLGVEETLGELLELEEGIEGVLEELTRFEERLERVLEDGLDSDDDAVDEVLRFEEELVGGGCSCGCGCSCLSGPFMLAVGIIEDV